MEKTSLRGMVLPVKSLCVLSCTLEDARENILQRVARTTMRKFILQNNTRCMRGESRILAAPNSPLFKSHVFWVVTDAFKDH